MWTIGRVRNCLDAHLSQIVCDKDGVLDWSTTGLLKDWLIWVDPCRKTRCGGERQAIPFLALSQTQRLMVDVS